MCILHVKKHAHGAISYITNTFNLPISTGQTPDIWHEVIIIPFPKPGKDCIFDKNWRPFSLQYPAANELDNLLQPKKYLHTTSSTRLNIAFGRETRQALQCRRTPPTLLPAYQEKRRLSIRYSSRSIWKCIRQCGPWIAAWLCLVHQHTGTNQPLAQHLYVEQTKQSTLSVTWIWKKKGENLSVQRRCSVSSAIKVLYDRHFNTAVEHQADQVRRRHCHLHIWTSGGCRNQWPQHLSVAKAQRHQLIITVNVNVQINCITCHARYSLALLESTREAGRPSATDEKATNCVRSDARQPVNYHTTLQQYRSTILRRNNASKALVGSTLCCGKENFLPTYKAIGRSILNYCRSVCTPLV